MAKNFLLIILFVSIIGFCYTNNPPLFSEVKGTYSFYTKTSVSSNFISVDSSKAKKVKKQIKNLCGESVCFKFNKSIIDKVIKEYQAKLVLKESGKDFKSEYYYSKKIPVYQLIGGVKVNIHLAYGQETATIGSPIIYGSF